MLHSATKGIHNNTAKPKPDYSIIPHDLSSNNVQDKIAYSHVVTCFLSHNLLLAYVLFL